MLPNRNWLAIFIVSLLLVTIAITGSIMADRYGNPFVKWRAASDIRHYVLSQYPQLIDPQMGEVNYNVKDETYSIHISSDTSIDTHFDIYWREREMWDNFAYTVTGGQNTFNRLLQEASLDIARELLPVGEFEVFIYFPEDSDMFFAMDTPYERGRVDTREIGLLQLSSLIDAQGADEATATYLSDIIPRIFEILNQQGFVTQRLDLTLSNQDYISQYHILSITRADAQDPHLRQRLQELESNFYSNPDNIFQDEGMQVIIQ